MSDLHKIVGIRQPSDSNSVTSLALVHCTIATVGFVVEVTRNWRAIYTD